MLCAVVIVIAFGVNQKINLDRSRTYEVSDNVYSILKMITKAEINGNQLEISGWAFDKEIYNESSTCEVILQDKETGEALWPKMVEEPKVIEIVDGYTEGRDYSGASFEGSLKINKLDESSVYEILIRYTTDFIDENGNEQKYVKTITTDRFLYQGQMSEYNPKMFIVPEVVGTDLEKVIQEGTLCYFSQDGMYIYKHNNSIYYIADLNFPFAENSLTEIPLHIFPVDKEKLSSEFKDAGFENRDIMFENYELSGQFGKYRVAVRELPEDYAIAYIKTGLFSSVDSAWVWKKIIYMADK